MKKVALFVHCYPPAKGGLEKLTGDLVKVWRGEGKEVAVFAGKGRTLDSYKTFTDYVDYSGDPEYVFRLDLLENWQRAANRLLYPAVLKYSLFAPWYFGPILKYQKKHADYVKNADLIIGAGLPTKMVWDAYVFAKKFQKKLHILPAYHNVGYYNNCPAFKKVFTYAEKIITLSDFEEVALLSNYPVSKGKTERYEYWPFNEIEMSKQSVILFRLNQLRDQRKRQGIIHIGYVGQITPRKNLKYFQTLLDEIEANPNKYPEYEGKKVMIFLAGLRTNGSALVEKQLERGIKEEKIKILYDFKDEEKEEVYGNIDFFINPSNEESLGIVNFEAKYFGCILMSIERGI